ncbi:MAG: hypothetical protein NC302_01745 [Bacteroidales bacterium]|nr:hypothetical protein [Bacteroidales bacterium]MCM1416257.1 hypothetical protein [bacterium]MCM1422387.1 hypothetical protein [bacterium]
MRARMNRNSRRNCASSRRFYAGQGFAEVGIVPCDFNGIPHIRLVLLEKDCDRSEAPYSASRQK